MSSVEPAVAILSLICNSWSIMNPEDVIVVTNEATGVHEMRARGLVAAEPKQDQVTRPNINVTCVTVKIYSARCQCGRVFHHRDKAVLEHNLSQHLARYHGVHNETRLKLEFVKKRLRLLQNRMHGT